MSDRNRSDAAPEREAVLSWDLIPDERVTARAIIMRFASREAAHSALTQAGYRPVDGSQHLLRHLDGRMAVRYSHPDGSTVVLAHPLAERHGDTKPDRERLRSATVGGEKAGGDERGQADASQIACNSSVPCYDCVPGD